MSPAVTVPAEPPAFDSKAFLAQKNAEHDAAKNGKPAPVVEKPAEATAQPAEEKPHFPNRAERRAQNRLREEIGELRGRLAAMQELMGNKQPAAAAAEEVKPKADPEPQRKHFASDAEYNRALGRWDARQEASKVLGEAKGQQTQQEQLQALQAEIREAEEKAVKDAAELFPDFDKVREQAAEDVENGDAPKFDPAEHPLFMMMLAKSDVRAHLLYHFAKEPDDLESMLALTGDQSKQIQKFNRLEGRMEVLYNKPKVAQAAGTKAVPKERAEAPAKGTAAARDAALPRPSAEVAARGGSAAPEDSAVGSRAWMEKRNQATGGR